MAKNTINSQNFFDPYAKPDVQRARRDPAYKKKLMEARSGKKMVSHTRTINPGKVFGTRDTSSGEDTKSKTGKKGNPVLNAISSIRTNVLSISTFLSNQAKEKAKLAKERVRNFEKGIEERRKKQEEEGLEEPDKPLKNALLSPVEEVGKRASGILQKLTDAIMLIFGGWFMDKGFKLIEAFGKKVGSWKKIAKNLIGPLALFSGVLATMFFGLGAVPLLIAKVVGILITVGGAILGFLLSPPGLITLAIAAGIGAAFLGIKKLNQFLRGGKDAEEARHKNKQKLRDAGIMRVKKDGARVMRDGKEVFVKTEDLTEEERAIIDEFKAEQQRIKDVTKDKKNKLKEAEKKIKADRKEEEDRLRREGRLTKDFSALHAHEAETKRLIKEEKKRIREEASEAYEDPGAKIEGISSDKNFAKVDKRVADAKIDQEVSSDNIEVVVNNQLDKKGEESLKDGTASNVPNIKSGDDDNMYTAFTHSQIGVTG